MTRRASSSRSTARTTATSTTEKICITLASQCAKLGLTVRVVAQNKSLFFAKVEKLDTSAYLLGWGGSITDAETTFTPIYRNRGEKGVGEYNRGNYKDDELDALAAASSKESDPEKRKVLIKQVFKGRRSRCTTYRCTVSSFRGWRAATSRSCTVRTTGSN